MLQKITNHIRDHFPFLEGKKLLIAISGGLDSVVLAHLITELNFDISLAHCNFQLRGKESDLDEAFVLQIAQEKTHPVFIKKFDTEKFAKKNKLSIQIAARQLRYDWFEELISKHHFDYVLTAHHADDNLETFLINLTRGSGLDGFTGIPAINRNIIRPLLVFSRDEISTFAKEKNIEWREDESNSSIKYVRNKIRHQVIPVLKELNPSLLETFSKTSKNLQESNQIIEDSVAEITSEVVAKENNVVKLDIEKLKSLSNPKAYLYQILKGYNFTEWNDVYHLLSAQSGKQIFSETHRLLKDRDFLLLSKNTPKSTNKKFLIEHHENEIQEPIHLRIEKVNEISTVNNQIIYVDADLLKFPLTLRKWKNGDYFYPKGMEGKKKISNYFKDKKLSLLEKENIWLLCSSENDIVWIVNERNDRRFLATKSTNTILKISI
jgi:tRNA(Ile)-lysidine synthase